MSLGFCDNDNRRGEHLAWFSFAGFAFAFICRRNWVYQYLHIYLYVDHWTSEYIPDLQSRLCKNQSWNQLICIDTDTCVIFTLCPSTEHRPSRVPEIPRSKFKWSLWSTSMLILRLLSQTYITDTYTDIWHLALRTESSSAAGDFWN